MIEGLDATAIGKIIAGVAVTVILALFGRSAMIRRLSKDSVVVATDTGHVDVIGTLQHERDGHAQRADMATKERDEWMRKYSEAMLEVGGLRQDVKHLNQRVTEQVGQILEQATKIESLQRNLDALTAHIASLMGLMDAGYDVGGGGAPHKPEGSNK
jgi:peptidoglycan hydrolase CwlO-like protein